MMENRWTISRSFMCSYVSLLNRTFDNVDSEKSLSTWKQHQHHVKRNKARKSSFSSKTNKWRNGVFFRHDSILILLVFLLLFFTDSIPEAEMMFLFGFSWGRRDFRSKFTFCGDSLLFLLKTTFMVQHAGTLLLVFSCWRRRENNLIRLRVMLTLQLLLLWDEEEKNIERRFHLKQRWKDVFLCLFIKLSFVEHWKVLNCQLFTFIFDEVMQMRIIHNTKSSVNKLNCRVRKIKSKF